MVKIMGFSNEDGLISKTKSMVLSLSSVITGSSRFPSPMQIQKQCIAYKHLQLLPGLKTLIYARGTPQTQSPTHPKKPLIIHSYTIPRSPPPSSATSLSSSDFQSLFRSSSTHSSSYSCCSSGMDDMLGTESGVYMSPNELKMPEMERGNANRDCNPGKRKQGGTTTGGDSGEYPPVIPLLARTGNLLGHMPWILTRHYSNGRLVLKEEKVKHHEYFEAYRENGRLVLDLVPLDDTVTCCHAVCEENDEEEAEDDVANLEFCNLVEEYGEETETVQAEEEEDEEDEEEDDDDGYVYQGSAITISSAFSVPKFCHGNERNGDPRKCLTYSGRILSEYSTSIMFCNAGDHQQEGSSAPLAFCAYDVGCLVK